MFWSLLLAHFTADYPLQTRWMVMNKTRFWVLGLHVAIHFVTMLAVAGRAVHVSRWSCSCCGYRSARSWYR